MPTSAPSAYKRQYPICGSGRRSIYWALSPKPAKKNTLVDALRGLNHQVSRRFCGRPFGLSTSTDSSDLVATSNTSNETRELQDNFDRPSIQGCVCSLLTVLVFFA